MFLKKRELMVLDSWSGKALEAQIAFDNISRYDAIWCGQLVTRYNYPVFRIARKQRPELLILHTFNADNSRANWEKPSSYHFMNKNHPDWFLVQDVTGPLKSDPNILSNRLRWERHNKKHSYYNRFFLDVTNKEFQNWMADYLVEQLASGKEDGLELPYDGIAMDNGHLGDWYRRMDALYPNWKYAGKIDQWNKGFIEYLKVIRDKLNSKGFVLVLNHSLDYGKDRYKALWDQMLSNVDGVMTEKPLGTLKKGLYHGDQWLLAMERNDKINEKGLINWWVCYPPEKEGNNAKVFLYTYCSWLLMQQPQKSYFYATQGKIHYGSFEPPWYPEYDLDIGLPKGKRYKKDHCWLRDYQNVVIVVNPGKDTRLIELEGDKFWLDFQSKTLIKRAYINAQSGRIFLPTPYTEIPSALESTDEGVLVK